MRPAPRVVALVAVVTLDEPDGARAFTSVACDRGDAVTGAASCLRTVRGIASRFEAEALDVERETVHTWTLPGIPSRTRLSDDGLLLATTAFVTGHAYESVGRSTETVVDRVDGSSFGNLEEFTFSVDGQPFTPTDRNFWGVTFVDQDAFYVTAASTSAGKTWLVRGSLSGRSLDAVREGVERPSVSPDRTRIALKKDVGTGGHTHWSVAVLDLVSGGGGRARRGAVPGRPGRMARRRVTAVPDAAGGHDGRDGRVVGGGRRGRRTGSVHPRYMVPGRGAVRTDDF